MSGVTILSEITVHNISIDTIMIVIPVVIISLIAIIVLALKNIKYNKAFSIVSIIFALIFTCVVFITCYVGYNDIYREYIVQVDEKASFKEFTSTYEIISEKDNDIYVVIRKDV